MNEEKLQIQARVLEYVGNAMQEDFDDGYASYDATRFEILAPMEFRGRQLMVFHETPPPAGTLWRKPGTRIRAGIARASLTAEDTLFAGALSSLEEASEEGR